MVDNTDYGDDAFVATVTTGSNGNMEQPLLLRKEYVWDGFILLALLEDYDLQERFLLVPHTGGQNHRFDEAMSDRNHFMSKSGQPEWNHFCDKCCRVWNGENGEQPKKLRVIVTDGITIGHPSCCIPHCPNPLDNNQDRFCQDHSAQNEICAIIGCTNRVDAGYKTCNLEYHRGMEEKRNMSHKGFFQLRDRLARQKVSHPNNAFQAAATDDVVEEHLLADTELDPVCQEKGPDGKRRIQAQFGRHRSHNEQILVRPCGMIVAQKTFFGSETTPQTIEFLESTFPTSQSMPEIVIYDLGCQAYQHLKKQGNSLYKRVGFPVDVFHWKTKHKKTSDACAYDCNPTLFKELIGDDGKTWFFNSSIAEQTNVWLGGYHAILREMSQVKFNFFLDEMILRKNRITKNLLQKHGNCPDYIPNLHKSTN